MPPELRRKIEAVKRQQRAKQKPQRIEIYRENLEAFQLFRAMRTCWDIHGFSGQYLGINYQNLPYFAAWRDAEDQGGLEDKLRVLERGALDRWAEEREKNRDQ